MKHRSIAEKIFVEESVKAGHKKEDAVKASRNPDFSRMIVCIERGIEEGVKIGKEEAQKAWLQLSKDMKQKDA